MTLALSAVPTPPRPSRLLRLTGLTAVALIAVFLVPFRAASVWPGGGYADVSSLTAAVEHGLVAWWSAAGDAPALAPALADPVAFWARFHAVKAALSVLLLVGTVLLAQEIWRAQARAAGRGARLRLTLAGVAEAPLALLALLLVVANVQGTLAPLSSAVSLVPVGASDPRVSATLDALRHELEAGGGRPWSPPTATLVSDFARYHVVAAVLGAIVAVLLGVGAHRLWRSRRFASARPRRAQAWMHVVAAAGLLVVAAGFALVAVANAGTALDPAPALLGFLRGGA